MTVESIEHGDVKQIVITFRHIARFRNINQAKGA